MSEKQSESGKAILWCEGVWAILIAFTRLAVGLPSVLLHQTSLQAETSSIS
jgi:hypothetical protein